MQDQYHNKSMKPEATKAEKPNAAEKVEDFFFPGEGRYIPRTIQARTLEEATEIYEKEKQEA
jgi:hypothetical protein